MRYSPAKEIDMKAETTMVRGSKKHGSRESAASGTYAGPHRPVSADLNDAARSVASELLADVGLVSV
jgi:hypothetical protein